MRGGKRSGAGRKPIAEENKRQRVVFCVAPDTLKRIDYLREKKVKMGPEVDALVNKLYKKTIAQD